MAENTYTPPASVASAAKRGLKQGEGWGVDSKGYQAWLLWGGDPGRAWADRIWKREKKQP